MPTGERRRRGRRPPQRGFTYLLLLFMLVIGGIGLAALGEQARQRALREQETELAFRGAEIAGAIASYVDAGPGGSRALPRSVDDLLEDRRSGRVVRHLRQLRPDPIGDGWIWLSPGEGGCSSATRRGPKALGLGGVRSSGDRLLLRRDGAEARPACDWLFLHEAYTPPARPAQAASSVSP